MPSTPSLSPLAERVARGLASHYRVERELGEGGMATVLLAHDLRHDRPVAIKILRPELAGEPGAQRFLREIRYAARLAHPNILPLFDSGTVPPATPSETPVVYYVMPHVAGGSLRQRLEREGQLPLAEAVRITGATARALDHAHAEGIVHRDIKPENILIEGGEAVLADLGIARALGEAGDRVTSTGLTLGTPAYMSPEQAAGDSRIDARSDQYSLACVAYEMLAGAPPFTGGTAQAIMARRLVEPPPRIAMIRDGCPAAVDEVLARAMARAPADRYASTGDFAGALAAAAHFPAAAPDSARPRRPYFIIAAVALAVAGVAAAAVLARRPRARPPAGPRWVMAVVPFAPTNSDSALTRLGRDLVVTVSHTLDGIGGIRTVDAQSILAHDPEELAGAAQAMRLASDHGAGAVLHGSLVRIGDQVRADLVLAPADSGAALGRVSATAPLDSMVALTDSIVRGVLRYVWEGGQAPSPSLDVALRTRSLEALRAFIAGEELAVKGEWTPAAEAYHRAIQADSSFLLARWREAYAHAWHGEPMDPAVRALLTARAPELPQRERMMIEATNLMEDSLSGALAILRELTTEYPDHWFGWLVYGDVLTHFGSWAGIPRRDAIHALRRALALNRNLVPAWEHHAWLTLLEHDTAGAAASIAALERAGPGTLQDFGWDQVTTLALTLRLVSGDSAGAAPLLDRYVADMLGRSDPSFGVDALARHGFPAEQVSATRRILARGPPSASVPQHRAALAGAFGRRGAWDSVFALLDEPGQAPILGGPLGAYRLTVVAALVGAVDASVARARRPGAARAAPGDDARAELHWLDGVLGFVDGDRDRLESAADSLASMRGDAATLLRQSLGALDRGLGGERDVAARQLVRMETARAERLYAEEHRFPALRSVQRIIAARWLAENGGYAEAERVLGWVEGEYAVDLAPELLNFVIGPVTWERARIAEAAGDADAAVRLYREFLRTYDLAPRRHGEMVTHATEAARRRD